MSQQVRAKSVPCSTGHLEAGQRRVDLLHLADALEAVGGGALVPLAPGQIDHLVHAANINCHIAT